MDESETQGFTLAREVVVRGVGLHTGAEVTVKIRPREEAGIVFVREDLPGAPTVRACTENLGLELRRTVLNEQGVSVQTAEHLLAVLYALEIDRAEIRLGCVELPGLDGSSRIWLEEIQEAGLTASPTPRRHCRLPAALARTAGKGAVVALPSPGGFHVEYTLDHDDDVIALQQVSFRLDAETFAREIAPCRTFVLEAEVEALLAAGLGRGATTDNTLVIGPDGVRDNTLRFPDEFARHKVLDLIGDLSLVECSLSARVAVFRSGHELNAALAIELMQFCAGTADARKSTQEAS